MAPIKPNITFFGEPLPKEFFDAMNDGGLKACDLLLVMGTALAVSPFNMIPELLSAEKPKVLFNMNNTKETGKIDFTTEGRVFV